MNNTVRAGLVASVVAAGVVTVPGVADAAAKGCGYPYVCVGDSVNHPTGRFRDVTTGWQYLGRSFGVHTIRNTRHDDVAFALTTTGDVICVRPGTTGGLMNGGITAIRISWRPTC